jgi:hypothetical protein
MTISYDIRNLALYLSVMNLTTVTKLFTFHENRQGDENAITTASYIVSMYLHTRDMETRLLCSQLHQSVENLRPGKSVEDQYLRPIFQKVLWRLRCFLPDIFVHLCLLRYVTTYMTWRAVHGGRKRVLKKYLDVREELPVVEKIP